MWKKIVGVFIVCLFIGTGVIPYTGGNIMDANEDHILTNSTEVNDIYTLTSCTDDSDVSEILPDENYGNSWDLLVQPDLIYKDQLYQTERWSFIRFDLSAIPSNSKITNAKLYLWPTGYGGSPACRTIDCYRVTSSWYEENVTWNNKPTFFSNITSSAIVPSNLEDLMIWDVTSDLQGFINGSYSNYGWVLKDRNENVPIGETVCSKGFSSKENSYESPILFVKTNKVKAKNTSGEKSDATTLEVTMPKNKVINIQLFLQKLFMDFPVFKIILNQIII